jgi:hypothetical protein
MYGDGRHGWYRQGDDPGAGRAWYDGGRRGARSSLFSISVEKGAETSIYLATSLEVEGVTGKYFVKKEAVSSSDVSYDEGVAARLWQVSEELTGLPASSGAL